MKSKYLVLLVLSIVMLVGLMGCSPTRYIYQQPYQGVLTGVNLNWGNSDYLFGSVELDSKTVVFGSFKDYRNQPLRELKMGTMYRLELIEGGNYFPMYNLAEVTSK